MKRYQIVQITKIVHYIDIDANSKAEALEKMDDSISHGDKIEKEYVRSIEVI